MEKANIDELTFEDPDDIVIWDDEDQGELLQSNATKIIIPKCEFLTGGAGTGKTYTIKMRMEEYAATHKGKRAYGVLAATTGIAAINLGDNTSTVNSVLRYFDIVSLKESYASGKLHQALKQVARQAENLIIDECSMMDAITLDIIWDALVEINQQAELVEQGGLGLILTGDFCQLPPIGGKDDKGKEVQPKYAFEALCWKYFEANTTKLVKVWRQNDPSFISALEQARKGEGDACASILSKHSGVRFSEEIDINFEGTTIFSKNVEVDRLNQTRLRDLLHQGREAYTVRSYRWGKQRGEWKNIPEELQVCKDAYVMILANDSKLNGFRFANGSTGYVEEFVKPFFTIRLKGKGTWFCNTCNCETTTIKTHCPECGEDCSLREMVVEINKVIRQVTSKDHPEGQHISKPEYLSLKEWKEEHEDEYESAKQAKFQYTSYLDKLTLENRKKDSEGRLVGEVFFDYEEGKWVIGEIHYYPIRLAYASTVHKSQGLTLDTVQIDFANKFFGHASMGYVALSRVRTAEGLRIVGTPKLLADRVNISRKVVRWI